MIDQNYHFYCSDIRKYGFMNAEEERAAFEEYARTKDEKLRKKIANSNLRFVLSVAKKYINSNVDISDLISIGSFGLMVAIDRFDVTKNNRFDTYAVYWIKACIADYIRTKGNLIYIPHSMQCRIKRAKKDRQMTDDLLKVNELNSSIVSINKKIDDDNESEIGNIIPDTTNEDVLKKSVVNNCINKIFDGLDDREQTVLKLLHGIGTDEQKTLREIGQAIGYSHTYVKKLAKEALDKIRNNKQAMKACQTAIAEFA